MIDLMAPVRWVSPEEPATALWRGLAQVLTFPTLGLDPSVALLNPGAAAKHTVQRIHIPLGDTTTPGHLFVPHHSEGATVVIAHGTTAPHATSYYMWVQALLARGINVLTFELDGHGENPRPLKVPDIQDNVPAAIAYARSRREIDPARVGLLGISLGGACSLHAAAQDPGVRAVVTVGSPNRIRIDEWGKFGEVLGLFNPEVAPTFFEASPNVLLGFLKTHLRSDHARRDEPSDLMSSTTRQAVSAALRQLDPLAAAASLGKTPLLVINGEWDFIAPSDHARELWTRAPGEKAMLLVPRRNHFTVMVSRRAVQAMADWFGRHV
ncbi:MAG: alpha/beta fold hydrolase [Candidatus Sericytochromatia bacterium]|nr:alpha/beta fold hydrolase [Candidatus Sericytochromatia bacterium]